jgi:hypothetical protein
MKFDSNGNVIIIEYFCPQCDGTNVSGFKRKFDEETQLWEKYDSGDCFCDDCDEPLNKESRNINPVRILCGTREIFQDRITGEWKTISRKRDEEGDSTQDDLGNSP